jgi:hypothetical protein
MAAGSIWVLRLRRWAARIVAALLVFGSAFICDFVEVGVVSPQVFGGLLSGLAAIALLRSGRVRRSPAEQPAHRLDLACLTLLAAGCIALAVWAGSVDASHTGMALPGVRCGTFYAPQGYALLGCDEAVQTQLANVLATSMLFLICTFLLVRLLVRVGKPRGTLEAPVQSPLGWEAPLPPPEAAATQTPVGTLVPHEPQATPNWMRRGRTWVGVAAVALLIGLVVTTLHSSKSTADDRAFDRLRHTVLAANAQPPDPCTLLTDAEVHASLGGPPIDATPGSQRSGLATAAYGMRACFWSSGMKDGLVSLLVITARSQRASDSAMFKPTVDEQATAVSLRDLVAATWPGLRSDLRPGQVVRKASHIWEVIPDLGQTGVLFVNTEAAGGGTFVEVSSEDGVAYFQLSVSGFPPVSERSGALALARKVSARLTEADH